MLQVKTTDILADIEATLKAGEDARAAGLALQDALKTQAKVLDTCIARTDALTHLLSLRAETVDHETVEAITARRTKLDQARHALRPYY